MHTKKLCDDTFIITAAEACYSRYEETYTSTKQLLSYRSKSVVFVR